MTDVSDFELVFEQFLSIQYPDCPDLEALRDWNSRLLTLDTYIAGHATSVRSGSIRADEIPEMGELRSQVEALRGDLDLIRPDSARDAALIDQYRGYVAALVRVLESLHALADRASG